MPDQKIRTFIALPLPPAVLDEIGKLVSHFRPLSRGIRWVNPQGVHLTLKFLGNLGPQELQKTFSALENLFSNPAKSFHLSIDGVGAFPNFKRPRVLWVGVNGQGLGQLKDLQAQTENALADAGFPKEDRKYSPHLTLGRIKNLKDIHTVVEEFSRYEFPEIEFTADQVHVMKSILKPQGADYSIQRTFKLND